DDALWQNLHLQENGKFSLAYQDRNSQINFIAVAHVAHVPPVLDEAGNIYGPNSASGGFLADYETFTTIYKQDLKATSSGPAPTTIWLRTDDDPGSLATVRAALNGGTLAVTDMADRRQQQGDIISNPLQLNIIGTLGLGAAVALVLALIGVLTASWINANSRLTSFAVLRALGTTPRQVLNMLLWEQGIVYVSALVIGALLGFVLSTATLPALVFTSLVANISTSNGPQPDVPPAHVILPPEWLGIAFGTLAVICAVAILITTVSVSRASLSESLRLNQD
ncbi:MAG TPA: FtsX-like permease family protein, partial [Ktedonobacterales bacterium]